MSYRGKREHVQLRIESITSNIPAMKHGRLRVVLHAHGHFHSGYHG